MSREYTTMGSPGIGAGEWGGQEARSGRYVRKGKGPGTFSKNHVLEKEPGPFP
jgi:hypothetical protein